MTEEDIRAGLERLSPFFHTIALPYGLSTHDRSSVRADEEGARVADLKAVVWPLVEQHLGGFDGLRVLDVATNAGGFAIEAARSGAAEVVGTDVVEHYLEQADFVRRALELDNLSFRRQAIESMSLKRDGAFDLVFCFDILYHLENPVLAMRRLAELTRTMMVIETRVTADPGLKGPAWLMNFLPPSEEGSLDRSTSRWRTRTMCQFRPTAEAVTVLLEFLGFDDIEQTRLGDYPGVQDFEVDTELMLYVARRRD